MKPFEQENGPIYLNSHVYPMPINEHDMSCYITTSRLQKLSRSQKYNEKSIRWSDNGQMYNTGSEKLTLLSRSRRQVSLVTVTCHVAGHRVTMTQDSKSCNLTLDYYKITFNAQNYE